VLRHREIEMPVPRAAEVLIKIHAASVNPLDWHFMRGTPRVMRMTSGLRKPKESRIGVDVAGVVEAIGAEVKGFKPGDAVFGFGRGAFAEYVCVAEKSLSAKLSTVTFEHAAAIPIAGITALQGLRDHGKIQAGQLVLINGAAGGVGTFAVQIAKSFGAEVTGVCSSGNVEMVRSLGANSVIDYSKEDFTVTEQRYDLILDCVGNRSAQALRRVLKPNASCIIVGASTLPGMLRTLIYSRFVSQRFVLVLAKANPEDLATIQQLVHTRKIAPVIDRRYRLSEVPQAIAYLEQGHARGKVAIAVI